MNAKFALYITTAILAFGFGCLFVQTVKKPHKATNSNRNINSSENKISKTKYPVNLFLILSTLFAAIYIIKLLLDSGVTSSLTDALRRIYEIRGEEDYSPGFLYNQLREVVVAIGYLNVFRLFIRLYSKDDKLSIFKLSVPIFVFLILILISTERNLFLRFAIYVVCMWVFVFSYKRKSKNLNFKIIFRAFLMLIVVILLFFLLGVAKQYTSSFFDQISIYSASGLNDFNIWIEDCNEPLLLGKSTFTTFLSSLSVVLSPLGINLGENVSQFDPFISYITANNYHYYSNIYTSLRPFVEDFGYIGVIIFPFIIGMFYQWLYLKVKHNNFELGLACIIYCMLVYSVIYFPISEQLFRRFHLGFVYELVWITVLYYLVFKRKKRKITMSQSLKVYGIQNEEQKNS